MESDTPKLSPNQQDIPKPDSKPSCFGAENPPHIPDYRLLRIVGKGGYGEVWLARNVTGAYLALKVVYRSSFEHQRPYDREFEGLQNYERVSRWHESQMPLLHVGRHERNEFFYYVMDLADPVPNEGFNYESRLDSGRAWTPETLEAYQPRTLESDLKRRGKIPIKEAIELGLSLTIALKHLHENGLIHRDIKPSNVLFVNGVPKLADVGLVALLDSTVSFVGTVGYIPPEGPGSAQADIYSLGKVLYEVATGMDRSAFPALPTEVDSLSHEALILEFNEIVMKACHGDPKYRFYSASELFDDLQLLHSGKSVRQKYRMAQVTQSIKKGAMLVMLAGLVVTTGVYLARGPLTSKSYKPVHILLPALEEIETAREDLNRFPEQFDVSPDGKKIVLLHQGEFKLWDEGNGVLRRLNLKGVESWNLSKTIQVRWSPDGKQFAFIANSKIEEGDSPGRMMSAFFVADPSSGEARMVGKPLPEGRSAANFCWDRDGRSLTYRDFQFRIYSLNQMGGLSHWLEAPIPGRRNLEFGNYSPDGTWLAVTVDSGSKDMNPERDIWLIPHGGGTAVPLVRGQGISRFPVWAPDGHSIYYVSGFRFGQTHRLWRIGVDPKTGSPQGEPKEVISFEGQKIVHPHLVAGGSRLVYGIHQNYNAIMVAPDSRPGKAQEMVLGNSFEISPDGQQIYYSRQTSDKSGIFVMDRDGPIKEARHLASLVPLEYPNLDCLKLSPDGRYLAVTGWFEDRMGLWVLSTKGGRPELLQPLSGQNTVIPTWSPNSRELGFAQDDTLYRISLKDKQVDPLCRLFRWEGFSIKWSPNGKYLGGMAYETQEDWMIPKERGIGVFVFDVTQNSLRRITPRSELSYKESLVWHPNGEQMTYVISEKESSIRLASADGTVNEVFLDQPDHWDYWGVWAPDGKRFFFDSTLCPVEPQGGLHLFDTEIGEIVHGTGIAWLPKWSGDGKTMVWGISQTFQSVYFIDDFQ